MDELSWRAKLAKSNINILNVDGRRWYYEFMYHPYHGSTKWSKTYFDVPYEYSSVAPYGSEDNEWVDEENAEALRKEVFKLRKELEA